MFACMKYSRISRGGYHNNKGIKAPYRKIIKFTYGYAPWLCSSEKSTNILYNMKCSHAWNIREFREGGTQGGQG